MLRKNPVVLRQKASFHLKFEYIKQIVMAKMS